VSRPLLVIDGDSLAHRVYHAIPKTIRRGEERRPANALVGFSNFLLRLWEAEQPWAIFLGWESLDSPTYRHELLSGYQGGR
jgi:DNA polymerase-1